MKNGECGRFFALASPDPEDEKPGVEYIGFESMIDGEMMIAMDILDSPGFWSGFTEVEVNTPTGAFWGLIDCHGEFVIEPVHFTIRIREHADGVIVDLDEGLPNKKCLYLDREGEMIVDQQFDDCGSFWKSPAPVGIDGKWGFIDKQGQWVVEPKFDEASQFYGGRSQVKFNGKIKYVDETGKFVEPTEVQ